MIVSDLPRSHRKSAGGKTCISVFLTSRELLARLRNVLGEEGLGFSSDSQSTPELWDPQESTCENLQWWKGCEPTLSLPLFQRGNKNALFSLPGSLFSWNLKNLISEAAEFGHFRV